MGTLQDILLLIIGILAINSETKYVKKRDVSEKIRELTGRNSQSFNVIISTSYKELYKKELISIRGNFVALNKTGLVKARDIKKKIDTLYGKTDWSNIRAFYEKK